MKRGPIYVWHGASSSKEAYWHIMPPGMRQSGSPPVGSPMTSAGQKRGWLSCWQILCHASPKEADRVTELGAHHLLGWADDSPSEEDDEQTQEEEDEPEGDEHKEAEEQEEEDPTNLEEQGEMGLGANPQRRLQEWGSMMDDEQPLTFDDPQSDSDTTVSGHSPVRLTPQVPGSPQDAVEVQVQDSEVEAL